MSTRSCCFAAEYLLALLDHVHLPDDIRTDLHEVSKKLERYIGNGFSYRVIHPDNIDDDTEFIETPFE